MIKIVMQWIRCNILTIFYVIFCIIFSITVCNIAKQNSTMKETLEINVQTENTQTENIQTESKQVQQQIQETNITGKTSAMDVSAYDSYFSDAVFVGDSVMYGFEKYVTKKSNDFLGNPQFLTIGNFALRLNLEPISEQSTHPLYKGKKCTIEQGISMMGAKKAFLFFGINDIAVTGIDSTVENYYTCIQRIREYSPNIQIIIISATYLMQGSEKTVLNNYNIRLFNEKIKANCASWGVEYIDIASYLMDGSGCLDAQYCSDGYVHQNEAAYQIWVNVLRNFASAKF